MRKTIGAPRSALRPNPEFRCRPCNHWFIRICREFLAGLHALHENAGRQKQMRIIDRYLGGQVLFSTLFGVFVLSFVLVLGNVFKEILPMLVNSQLPLSFVLKFVVLVLPFSLIFTIPWGLLMATLLVFGRVSADSELISLRMAGLSTPRICLPAFIIAACLSIFCLYINSNISPRAKAEMKRMFALLAVDNPLVLFRENTVTKEFPGFIFHITEKQDNVLKDLQLVELADKRPIKYISSPQATLQMEENADSFTLVLKDANVEWRDVDNPGDLRKIQHGVTFEELSINISLENLISKVKKSKPSTKKTSVLRREIASGMDENTGQEISPKKISGLRTEISRRYAFALACFVFTLVGIPLGVTTQRRETSIGFAISLAIACCYFIFITVADSLRESPEYYPHVMMWLPCVVFICIGVILFSRLCRR
jgi:lipopolysaccharide export system permease protein